MIMTQLDALQALWGGLPLRLVTTLEQVASDRMRVTMRAIVAAAVCIDASVVKLQFGNLQTRYKKHVGCSDTVLGFCSAPCYEPMKGKSRSMMELRTMVTP